MVFVADEGDGSCPSKFKGGKQATKAAAYYYDPGFCRWQSTLLQEIKSVVETARW